MIDSFLDMYNKTYEMFSRDQVSLFKIFNIACGRKLRFKENKHIIFNNVF